ncbi:MAG: hypothetical protein AB7K68_12610 [Bacteriovoracia bacterium]
MKNILSLTLIALIACPAPVVFAESADPLAKLKLSDTPFEVCKSKAFLPSKVYNEDKAYWDQAIKECGDQVSLEVLPDDSFFTIKTILTKLDGSENDQAKAVDFLKQVGGKAKENIAVNVAYNKMLLACAEHPTEEGCESVLKNLAKTVNKVRPELRQALALSGYATINQVAEMPEARLNVNRSLGAPAANLAFEGKMEPLNDSELADAVDAFEDDTKDIRKSWDEAMERRMEQIKAKRDAGQTNPVLENAYADAKAKIGKYNTADFAKYQTIQRGKKFSEHRQEYVKNIFKAPILAYLGKDKAIENCASNGDAESCHAVAMAAKKLLGNAEAEAAKLDKTIQKNSVSDLLEIMKYGPAVREVLEKNQNYCQSATGLTNLLANKDTRNSAVIMGGMITGFVAGGFAGGAVLSAAGVGTTTATILGASTAAVVTGAASIYVDAKHADREEQRVMNFATEENGKAVGDMKDLTDAKDALAFNIALSPTAMLGTGIGKIALGGAAASLIAANQGAKSMAKLAANNTLRAALKEKGHSEAAITKLFADLNSKDATVARKAAQAMIHDLDFNEDAMGVIRTAASKGLISQFTQRAATKAIREDIKNASMAKRVMDIMAEVNTAKLNDGNRLQVLEAALAGAKFGVENPKYLAAKINDWETGLDGLTATYRLAEKKMASSEVRGLASLEAKQQKAFELALDEQIEMNPALKGLSRQEKLEMKQQMATCGLKGK